MPPPGPGPLFAWLGAVVTGLGLVSVAAAVVMHRRDGWSVSEDGVSPPPRAVALGEDALAGAALALGASGVLQGVETAVWDPTAAPPASSLFDVGPSVLLVATVGLAVVGTVALVGGAAWRWYADGGG